MEKQSSKPAALRVATTCNSVRAQVHAWRAAGQRVAFVPTMGNLHGGHLSLLAAARSRADRVVASIFVNPLQFGPNEDFTQYPRTPDEDQRLLAGAQCDLLFAPSVEQMYPANDRPATLVTMPGLNDILCGEFRPGHFDGVATVVAKLFGIVAPDIAVFGEKDFQQLMVIRRMTQDLNMPVEIAGAPIMRAADGLALSSRNRYLSADERANAPQMYAALREAITRIGKGDTNYAAIESSGYRTLQNARMQVDYFSVRDADDLSNPHKTCRNLVVLAAARLGKTRLIDNLQINRLWRR
jgi:pantoate--beta-alanine ligase